MHKNATKYNETLSKWCKNKHGASEIIDMFETYQGSFKTHLNKIQFLVEKTSAIDLDASPLQNT
jgi:hypothetical protein